MLNYCMIKVDPFFNVIDLKAVYVFRSEYIDDGQRDRNM
jgi:hypothetical protein